MDIIEELASFSDRPFDFVLWAFPWGEPGSELEDQFGPDVWQAEFLQSVQRDMLSFHEALARLEDTKPMQYATTSGHGVGKSAVVSWLIWWAFSTFEDTKGVVTANTENQLKTKTWAEVAKWYRLFIAKDLFKMTATAIYSADPDHERTWRVEMVPWSERNTEAFAGMHNKGKRILVVFDEGSAIPDLIYEVTEGALTDANTQIIWAVFGNPTRNKGRFRECFPGGRFAHRWNTRTVDSRSVRITNKTQIAEWIADHGLDSDFVRVRVLGKFPRVDAESFISYEVAVEATTRQVDSQSAAIVIGVDVGRFGNDPSVIYPRCGRDARSYAPEIIYKQDLMFLAARVASTFLALRASIVFVDSGGVGGGVVDRLRQLRIPVVEVDFGSKPDGVNLDDGARYANKRAEIWGALRTFLKTGAIPDMKTGDNITLVEELTSPNYGLNVREEIQIESKKDMRRRGVPSPNVADALACTFAYPSFELPLGEIPSTVPTLTPDYDPFSRERIY